MLVHCLRRWPNIKPTLCRRLVFAESQVSESQMCLVPCSKK